MVVVVWGPRPPPEWAHLDRKTSVGCEWEPGSRDQGASDICWTSLLGPLLYTHQLYMKTNPGKSNRDRGV